MTGHGLRSPALLITLAAVLIAGGVFLAHLLSAGDAVTSGETGAPPVAAEADTRVSATVETTPVPSSGDAADDPAIWVNARTPAQSAVIATDKRGGLAVYDLSGRELQYLPAGRINNVDVRPEGHATSFVLDGEGISLVAAGNRSSNSIALYELVADTRQLRDVAARVITPGIELYGSCMYRSPVTGTFYVFVNSKSGEVEQWELFDDAGKVDARLVRSFDVGGTTEGCVADDELGHFYISEEAVGIWKYGAEPDAGTSRTSVASTTASGPLVSDVEGLTIAYGPGDTGHLIASSQGSASYVVYRRDGDNAFVRSFPIADNGSGIDGTEHTDGIDVTTSSLGPAFPHGLFVAQDGTNAGGNQNYKLVPWEDVLPG